MNVLRARAETDQSGWYCAQKWKPEKQPREKWQLVACARCSSIDAAMNLNLQRLNEANRKFAALLNFFQLSHGHRALS